MFTQSAMHFCAWRYPLLLPLLGGRYLLPGATPKSPTRFRFLSWQRLRNCLCKFQATPPPPHTAPSKPYPLPPAPFSLSFLVLESTFFFFLSARWPLLPSHTYSLPVGRPFYPHAVPAPIYTALSTLPLRLPPPTLLRSFFAFVTWAHFHCQRQRCTRHLHSNFCLAALEMQLPIPHSPLPPSPPPHPLRSVIFNVQNKYKLKQCK